MRYMAVPLEVRELGAGGEEGRFTGHASVFGNVDSYGTIIDAGAFKRTLKAQKGQLPITFFHMPWHGIGIARSEEDNTGLAVDGFLNINSSRDAAEVYAGLPDPTGENPAAGYYSQMSHGFDPVNSKADSDGIRHYTEVKSYEVAILMTNFAANPEANIENVRAQMGILQMALRGGNVQDIREMITATRAATDDSTTLGEDVGILVVKNSTQVRELLERLNTFTALFDPANPPEGTPQEDPQPRRILDPLTHSRVISELRKTLSKV